MAPSPSVLPPPPSLSRPIYLPAVLACPGMRVPGLPGGFPTAPSETLLLGVERRTWSGRSAGDPGTDRLKGEADEEFRV